MTRHPVPWWSWRWTLPLDVLITVLVVGSFLATIGPHVRTAFDKARMSQVLPVLQPARIIAGEQLALTGEFHAADAAALLDKDVPQGASVQVRADTLLVTGTLRRGGETYAWSWRPALADAAPTGHVLWLCATRPAPPGWTAGGEAIADHLTPPELFAPCRAPLDP